eukprot:TRINITY_DN5344_c1_g1_i8.p2 TRINITY_DN5344_c1_g1~~TRINITY_DN5344_c1_g1_i8.p2  ORF type:complete len:621 (+),score=0.03 TRINITY_DN5344_c1_g1_i8:767-2629(+)
MTSEEVKATSPLRKLVKEFNQETRAHRLYYKRRKVQTTPTVFFDNNEEILPPFRSSSLRWCSITEDLTNVLEDCEISTHIVRFEAGEEEKVLVDPEFLSSCQNEISKYLYLIADLYLNSYYELANTFPASSSVRVKERVLKLRAELEQFPAEMTNRPSMIDYFKKQVKLAKGGKIPKAPPKTYAEKRSELIQKVIQLRDARIYSVNDICSMCKISSTTYYLICRRQDRNEWQYIRPRGRPFTEDSLRSEEKEHVKYMADTPKRSYTVPEMCAELTEQYQRNISRNKVYTYLTKQLRYSYKRNNYKPAPAFETRQVIVRYKVCKKLLEYLREGKNIICLDESGFDLGVHQEYSYAKRGKRPFRMGMNKSQRLNLIMAITNESIFAYQVRKGNHNEHSFISFVLDITRKICQLGPEYLSKAVLFLDNARFHTSNLALKLLNLLPFPVFFNAYATPEYNALENVLSVIKRRVKKLNSANMQLKLASNYFRGVLWRNMYEVIFSIESSVFYKCYIRVLQFIENGMKGIDNLPWNLEVQTWTKPEQKTRQEYNLLKLLIIYLEIVQHCLINSDNFFSFSSLQSLRILLVPKNRIWRTSYRVYVRNMSLHLPRELMGPKPFMFDSI